MLAAERVEIPARTVLLVEDDDDIREAVGLTLGGIGYRIMSARNGRHALELLAVEAEPPSLIVRGAAPLALNASPR